MLAHYFLVVTCISESIEGAFMDCFGCLAHAREQYLPSELV